MGGSFASFSATGHPISDRPGVSWFYSANRAPALASIKHASAFPRRVLPGLCKSFHPQEGAERSDTRS